MKVIAINGSPRTSWNTATLLKHALEGAESGGAETELIQLYDLQYKGCVSCFACKRKGGDSYGRCVIKDDLEPVFYSVEQADAVILGSPIYFHNVTGEMKSFLERLLFQYYVYDEKRSSLFGKSISAGFIYTMNLNETNMDKRGYVHCLKGMETSLAGIFGSCESIIVNDTYQFDDYNRYVSSAYNEQEKAKRRTEVFPEDCKKAFDMGMRFAKKSGAS